jgi:signal transduction histidine kinase/ligand-binding sensor domain-containing protein
MIKKPLAIIFILNLMFSLIVRAQLNTNNLSVYAEMEGVVINDVMTDRMGNVWMATGNGLVRFDGYEYKRFYPDPNDPASMASILTYKLFEDREGNIWIGSMDYVSIYNYQKNSFENYKFSTLTDFPDYAQPVAIAFAADLKGRIYFGIASIVGIISTHALVYKEPQENRLRRFEYADSLVVRNIFRAASDKTGNIWLVAENGFFRIDHEGIIHQAPWPLGEFPSSHQYFQVIESDPGGSIWIASNDASLNRWDPESGQISTFPVSGLLRDKSPEFLPYNMEIDPGGNIWLGSSQGLLYFDIQKEKFELPGEEPEFKFFRTEIKSLTYDSFDNLWMGTETNGLLRYSNRAVFSSFVFDKNDKNSITSGWANKIFENADGKAWIVTSGGIEQGGVNLFDSKTRSITPYPYSTFLSGLEWCYVIGGKNPGEILLNSDQGFLLFNTTSKSVRKTSLDPQIGDDHIFNLLGDSRGNLWYCTFSGLYKQPKGEESLIRVALWDESGPIPVAKEVSNIYEGKKNKLWVLTNNGLFHYDYLTGKVERHGFDKEKGDIFISQDINSIYEDDEGTVWVGTWEGGLCRYELETREIKTYTTSDGLPSMSIQGILPDEPNNALWISTFDGISRFSIDVEQFNNFSLIDGIQGRLFADGAYLKTTSGLFMFGGNNGITVFDPNEIEKNSMPPRVYITDFKVGNTSVAVGSNLLSHGGTDNPKEIALKYGQNNISFDYTGIHFASPSRNTFAYKLENYDDNWREVGNQRTAYYYGLPPGKYTFRVRAANSNGVWNKTGASVSIWIRPPWWLTWWAYSSYVILFLLLLFLLDRFQRKRIILKERIQAREKELEHAKEIEKAYTELKTTQSQLIQSEKMASLGELTAGIAHEIQNPLNFVNNFSEVSAELIDEMKQELSVGSWQLATEIAEDIKQNLEKINHHGKRADAIVKGMLQHSRINTGQKELTNINALADEYLRLAYHGLRAKDKTFNAVLKTDFDPDLPKVEVVPQDIGRVLLNLINNAFYAVSTQNQSASSNLTGLENTMASEAYQPTVTVSTRKTANGIEISVKDNGNGIPDEIKDKIFQPFFTTKPTGQGTGLGLSLSYDIVKAHGGELRVETKEGFGTEFIIVLPTSA